MTKKYFVEVNMEGRIVGYSEDAVDITGYTLEDLQEMTVFDLVEDLLELLAAIEQGAPVGTEYDINLIHKSGQRIPVKVHPILNMRGSEIHSVKCTFYLV